MPLLSFPKSSVQALVSVSTVVFVPCHVFRRLLLSSGFASIGFFSRDSITKITKILELSVFMAASTRKILADESRFNSRLSSSNSLVETRQPDQTGRIQGHEGTLKCTTTSVKSSQWLEWPSVQKPPITYFLLAGFIKFVQIGEGGLYRLRRHFKHVQFQMFLHRRTIWNTITTYYYDN